MCWARNNYAEFVHALSIAHSTRDARAGSIQGLARARTRARLRRDTVIRSIQNMMYTCSRPRTSVAILLARNNLETPTAMAESPTEACRGVDYCQSLSDKRFTLDQGWVVITLLAGAHSSSLTTSQDLFLSATGKRQHTTPS